MKLKQITILKKPVLLVDGIPDGAKLQITEEGILIYEVEGVKDVLQNAPPIKMFVGAMKDLTEEQAAELVERVDPWAALKWYRDYMQYENWLNPKYSFLSALEKEGVLFHNPLDGTPIPDETGILEIDDATWQAAESNVFSQDTLIFIQQ